MAELGEHLRRSLGPNALNEIAGRGSRPLADPLLEKGDAFLHWPAILRVRSTANAIRQIRIACGHIERYLRFQTLRVGLYSKRSLVAARSSSVCKAVRDAIEFAVLSPEPRSAVFATAALPSVATRTSSTPKFARCRDAGRRFTCRRTLVPRSCSCCTASRSDAWTSRGRRRWALGEAGTHPDPCRPSSAAKAWQLPARSTG